jgi:hypothetical protein
LEDNNTNPGKKGENKRKKWLVEGGNEVNENVFLRRAEEESVSDVESVRVDNGQLLTEII